MIDIFNDHFVWQVQQSGIAHQVLKGQSAGSPLQLGQAGDNLDVLGSFVLPNNTFIQQLNSLAVAKNLIGTDSADKVIIRQSSGNLLQIKDVNNNIIAVMDSSGNFTTLGYANVDPPAPPVLNGSTSGTLTIYEVFRGANFKIVRAAFNNFRNGGASTQQLALPTAFVSGVMFWSGDIPGVNFMSGGIVHNSQTLTALAAGGGTTAANSIFANDSFGRTDLCDTIRVTASNASAHTGDIFMVGA